MPSQVRRLIPASVGVPLHNGVVAPSAVRTMSREAVPPSPGDHERVVVSVIPSPLGVSTAVSSAGGMAMAVGSPPTTSDVLPPVTVSSVAVEPSRRRATVPGTGTIAVGEPETVHRAWSVPSARASVTPLTRGPVSTCRLSKSTVPLRRPMPARKTKIDVSVTGASSFPSPSPPLCFQLMSAPSP